MNRPESRFVLGLRVDGTTYADAARRIVGWARAGEARYVCAANVHMVMEAYDSPDYRAAVNRASLVTPDGMPLVWSLRAMGLRAQPRVYGPDLTLAVSALAEQEQIPLGLYGSTPDVVERLQARLKTAYPKLRIAYACSPPYRPLNRQEDQVIREQLTASGAQILFVGLGCPKQELWMAAHADLPLVSVGVGAAFDFLSGRIRQAPRWMQEAGLEWAFRLGIEPGRLWKRYLKHNSRFLALIGPSLLRDTGRRQ